MAFILLHLQVSDVEEQTKHGVLTLVYFLGASDLHEKQLEHHEKLTQPPSEAANLHVPLPAEPNVNRRVSNDVEQSAERDAERKEEHSGVK